MPCLITSWVCRAIYLSNHPNKLAVWGPEPIRLGFIGAPIATACAFNLVCLMNIFYAVFVAPRTAWQPISRRSFTSLGVLLHLGLSGVGMQSDKLNLVLPNKKLGFRADGVRVVGMGAGCISGIFVSASVVDYPRLLRLSRLGPVSLATQSILLSSASTTYQAPFALSVASSVRSVDIFLPVPHSPHLFF